MKQITAFFITLFSLLMLARPVQAIADPPLFSCTSILGQSIASYSTGTHGVAGQSTTYEGQDSVSKIDEDHVLQCLCPNNSDSGVQSNWWRVPNMSQDDLEFFQRRGWVFVPNGLVWGLSDSPYLVKNDNFSCAGIGGGNNGGDSNNSSDNGVGGTGSVLGSSTLGSVLGASTLANTGNLQTIALYFALSLFFGLIAYRASKV